MRLVTTPPERSTIMKVVYWNVVILFFASELTQWRRLFLPRNNLTCLLHKSSEKMIIILQISECIKLRQCLVEDIAILRLWICSEVSFIHPLFENVLPAACFSSCIHFHSCLLILDTFRLDLETRRHCYGQFFSNNFSISMSCCQATCGPIVSE